MVSITGKTVLVTGASAGIGRACAREFARAGARVIIAARRLTRLQQLGEELQREFNADVLPFELDVTQPREVELLLERLPADWQEIDILVNNAGMARGVDKLHQADPADWEEMIATNINGLLYVSRCLIPSMVERGSGHVINIGSIAGHQVYPGGNVYCATKHAVKALSEGMNIDLLGSGVRVSSVDPGLVETEFSQVRFRGDRGRAAAVYQGIAALRGEDIAEAVLFCATRPPHVNVADMIVFPTAQAGAMFTHREEN
ncbi:MAG: SDR family oxidoreductase [Candidatus Delongbacteria bacterium]|nr:SDR family oxidoreductase [Candidatus Delongbacteria bacterium]